LRSNTCEILRTFDLLIGVDKPDKGETSGRGVDIPVERETSEDDVNSFFSFFTLRYILFIEIHR